MLRICVMFAEQASVLIDCMPKSCVTEVLPCRFLASVRTFPAFQSFRLLHLAFILRALLLCCQPSAMKV